MRFTITYQDARDPAAPRFTTSKYAPSRSYLQDWLDDTWSHAEWEIVRIERVKL